MKATIGGITIEGTPQEITEYQRIANGNESVIDKLPNPQWPYPHPYTSPWWGVNPPYTILPKITCGSTTKTIDATSWNGQTDTREWDGIWRQ